MNDDYNTLRGNMLFLAGPSMYKDLIRPAINRYQENGWSIEECFATIMTIVEQERRIVGDVKP